MNDGKRWWKRQKLASKMISVYVETTKAAYLVSKADDWNKSKNIRPVLRSAKQTSK